MPPNPLANTLNCHYQLLFLIFLSATYCSTQGKRDIILIVNFYTTSLQICTVYLSPTLVLYTTNYPALAEFTEAPVDLNVTEGDALSLNCTFTGAERIFWLKDGEEITSENATFQVTDLSAAATSTLSLVPSAEHTVHTGVYDCVAVMSNREVSTNFTITVQCK